MGLNYWILRMGTKNKRYIYLRDGRAPIPKREITSRIMSAIKSKNTKPELLLRKALWSGGIKGYRLHWQNIPGRPDICYVGKRVAIFVHGCYWHRCPNCKLKIPKSHSMFWKQKFLANIKRDQKKSKILEKDGWRVLVLWECQVTNDIKYCVEKIKRFLKN